MLSSLRLLLVLPLLLGFGAASAQPAESLDAIDYDRIEVLSYSDHIQPLLAGRDAFGFGDADAYAWDALFESEAGAAIIPFDAEGSTAVRFVEDLADTTAIPYPNLRTLEADELRALKRWIEAGAQSDDGVVPYADAEHVLFVGVQGENYVALVDAARRRVIRHVHFDDHDLPSAPYGPHHMVFEPDESAWYVSLISAGAVAKLSMDLTMDPSDPAYLIAHSELGGFTTPGMMALDADAGRLYVGRSTLSSAGTYGLGAFDTATMELDEEIPLPAYDVPHALALTPDGQFLLTAPLTGRDALVVDTETSDLVHRTPLGEANRELVHFSVLPDGETATLTSNSEGRSEVLFFRLGADGSLTPDGAVPTGARAWHGHLDRDGRTVLVPNRAGNSVTLVDVPTKSVRLTAENPIEGGPIAMPHSPAPTYDGAFFVTSSNLQGTWTPPFRFLDDEDPDGDGVRQPLPADAFGNLTVLDAETGAVEAVIPLGRYPSGVEHPMHGMHHDGMDHGGMNHDGMDHDGHH
jgi:DNA-binding beta-propeller fold protein YncE